MEMDLGYKVFEQKNNVIVEIDLPKVNKKTIKIIVKDGSLEVSGNKEEVKEIKEKDYYSKSIAQESLYKRFSFPFKTSKFDWEYKDNLLKIAFSKK
jgi:HSP20 family molecular chaperone IbpA